MKAGRNDPCPCGSGKKFKKCCQLKSVTTPVATMPAAQPGNTEINQLAALFNAGKMDEAEASARRMAEHYPDAGFGWKVLGACLKVQGRDAVAVLARAALLLTGDAEAHNNLGAALADIGDYDKAVASYRQALQIHPDYVDAHSNLGSALKGLGKLEASLGSYRRALQINPDYADAHNNLGVTLTELGQLDAAIASCRRAIQLKPNSAIAHLNLSVALLSSGQLSEGWREYEFRWSGSPRKLQRPVTPLPQWTGQLPQPGDRLLVFEEQGMGDKLQFSRYLKLARQHFPGGVSFVICRPLQALMRRSFPEIEIVEATPSDQSRWQWQCPLLSLPLALNTTMETIPAEVPYLEADPAKIARWRDAIARLHLPATTRKIGVTWRTGTYLQNAPARAVALRQLAPLLQIPDTAWFSLQKEPDPDKDEWVASGKLIDWSDQLLDFDDTAALTTQLDLVISVDTSIAHLAGGLGKPVWLFNRHASEWRWLLGREDSPWYPTMRLFNQKVAGDWDEVVHRMKLAL